MRSHRFPVFLVLLAAVVCVVNHQAKQVRAADETRPNIVLIFADDQGYADVGVFGAKGFKTPNLDQLAKEGVQFTSFYVSQAVCGASRASLLSGCYSNRVSILGAPGPSAKIGIHRDETLLPEVLKSLGYATGMFGKWHLGHRKQFLPPNNGFDEYFGLPYSNDMWPYHPTIKTFPNLPLIDGTEVINPAVTPEDQTLLTREYTARAVRFIDQHKEEPFFLYVAHAMPHVPLYCSTEFNGSSEQGAYGDVIQEIDWGVGQIMEALERHELTDNTLVIYTSDNGPWLSYGNHAGSAGPLREGKGTAWEGGVRVPCIMRWPAKIPGDRVVEEMAATIDVLPTICALTGADLPERKIDGVDISPLLTGEATEQAPRQLYHYYYGRELRAVRKGPWKLVFPHSYRSLAGEPGSDGQPGPYKQLRCELELYNLAQDVGEAKNVVSDHPRVVAELQEVAVQMRDALGDSLTKRKGTEIRASGRVD